MKNYIIIKKKIENFKKKSIEVEGDKSLSIRFVLLSALTKGKCYAINLLKSEDVLNAINCINKLGIKTVFKRKKTKIYGRGLYGLKFRKNLTLDTGNSGTTARLLCSLLIDTNYQIKITGDQSLKKRDMKRIINPLKKFGAFFKSKNGKLPLVIKGTKFPKPIKFTENLGSAQCKSAVMIAALKTKGVTKLKCLPSRNHTELMFKNILKIPIKIVKKKKYEMIKLSGQKELKPFNYKIPGDISSASFFLVLTLLSKNKILKIKNVNLNSSRTGVIKILKMMGGKIKISNLRNYKGEKIGDIIVRSTEKLNSINLSSRYNSSAIDEFLLIFLVACKCKGISIFNNLGELNKKESKRLDWGIKILSLMGVKVKKIKNSGIKIWGKENFHINRKIIIKNYLKDHRILMVSVIAGLTIGGNWRIHDQNCYKTSFPSFKETLKKLGAQIK